MLLTMQTYQLSHAKNVNFRVYMGNTILQEARESHNHETLDMANSFQSVQSSLRQNYPSNSGTIVSSRQNQADQGFGQTSPVSMNGITEFALAQFARNVAGVAKIIKALQNREELPHGQVGGCANEGLARGAASGMSNIDYTGKSSVGRRETDVREGPVSLTAIMCIVRNRRISAALFFGKHRRVRLQ